MARSDMDPLEVVLHYHERTKHHPNRYARSLGYLDWATQPDPFRRFAGAELIPLPSLTEDDTQPYEALYEFGFIEPAPLTARTISRFLECSLAISAWKEYRGTRWALRANPSSGNLHPTEGYLILPPVEGISAAPGVYHYAPREHALERRAEFDATPWRTIAESWPSGSFLVGITSVLWREAWKYGERAFRYCQHDVGHAIGALRLSAAMLGWRLALIEDLSDTAIGRLLGLDRPEDFAGAEQEEPELLAAVFPCDGPYRTSSALGTEAVTGVAEGKWAGKANQLSKDHIDWDVIDLVADATRFDGQRSRGIAGVDLSSASSVPHDQSPDVIGIPSPGSRSIGTLKEVGHATPLTTYHSLPPPAERPSAHRIIRQRRSAVAFDGETTISPESFYHILARVMPRHDRGPSLETGNSKLETRHRIPFDALPWSPRIHLLMFVHRVTGLSPGLYALVRDQHRLDALKAAMASQFVWSRPPDCPEALPLYQLQAADCRKAAAQLSLGQDIAGDGAFSLGMVADFDRSLREFGPWFYRRLFWEAGLIGQVLYLEAEAAGIRATGIGAYFDDWVHEVFGLTGQAFQSLYHFTMGGPVEDARLTTLPAYPWSRD